jgi:hypothetical protein
MPTNINGITGTDGIVPVYEPNARWAWWNMNEIFNGGPGANRYVPKVNDYVEDIEEYITYKVTALDPVTLIPTLVPITRPGSNGAISLVDRLVGTGPGVQSDTPRVYLDTSVTPHVLAVDTRFRIAGSMSSYAKIFKGTNLSSNGDPIGFLYDSNGTFLTQNIPLELVAIDSHVNHSIRVVAVAYTNQQLNDGEIVTVVIYTDDGHVVSKQQFLVENTSFIRSVNVSQRYVSSISLESPFLSTTDNNTLEYPINVPLVAFNMVGVVNYSDGSKLRLPVDNSRFKIFGLERYVATVVGQEIDLVLSYALGPLEIAYGAVNGDGKFVTEPFKLRTINQVGSYTSKLFCYPVWNDPVTGYTLKWFLYNLDRDISFDVTPFVNYATPQNSFVGTTLGVNQQLIARVNLRDVSPIFNSYIHVQNVEVLLREPGTARTTNWSIKFEPTQMNPYGVDLHVGAVLLSASSTRLNLRSGCTSQNEWLQKLYFNTKPLYDSRREINPPTPNFFAIEIGSARYEYPVSAWNNDITVPSGVQINDTLFIEWFRRTATGDILLGKSGLPIYEN